MAERISQRAMHFARDYMHHPEVSAGHYLWSFASHEGCEDFAIRFTRVVRLRPETIRLYVQPSQPRSAGNFLALEHFTASAKRMFEIAGTMAAFRLRNSALSESPRMIPEDLATGVLLSSDPVVDELTLRKGVSPSTALRQLGIEPAPGVLELLSR